MEKLNKVFKTAEIASIDKYTIEHEPVSPLDLMERASLAWTKKILEKFPSLNRVTVIAGSGNNGGDGFAIARLLMGEGVDVNVLHLPPSTRRSAGCEANYLRYKAAGGALCEIRTADGWTLPEGGVVVDAIFGTGLNRPVEGTAAAIIRKINASRCTVVAVDMPSGLMGEDNSANDRTAIVRAAYTFTFQFPRLAFMLAENAPCVGEWSVLDIGLHPDAIRAKPSAWYYVTRETAAACLPAPPAFAHKGTNGRGLLIAGNSAMMGAAVLAGKAAVRSGIGLLHCHVPHSARDIIYTSVPEALVDTDESEYYFSGVGNAAAYDAVAAGPAIGRDPETREGLKRLLQSWRGTTILDADALNIIATNRKLLSLLHKKCILTPHAGEFERLAGKCENDFDRLNKLSTFAHDYNTYIILKGAYTVIATPEGELYFNMSGNPGMAKGGAGDVLTGVLLALAANGLPPLEVAVAGVYAHGLSGDLAAAVHGKRGICAGMIAEGMGKAWRQLEQPPEQGEIPFGT